jgi:hypothetical protein
MERRAHDAARAGVVGPALADACASVHRLGEVAAVRSIGQGQVPAQHRGGGNAHVGIDGARVDQDAGVKQVLRIESVLDRGEKRQRFRGIHQRKQLAARPAVAMLPGQRPPVAGHQSGGGEQKLPEGLSATGLVERPVDAHVHAPVAEMPVWHSGQPVVGHQGFEVAQISPERGRRHSRVLPAGMRRQPGWAAAGQTRAVSADLPEHRRPGGVGDDQAVCHRAFPSHPLGLGVGRAEIVADHLDEQPCRAGGERRHRHRPTSCADHVDDPRVHALAGGGAEAQHRRGTVARRCNVGIAQHHQHSVLGLGDQPDRRLGRDPERALAADQHPGDVEPVLRQKMPQRIAGHLAVEPAELGANRRQPEPCYLPQGGRHRRLCYDWSCSQPRIQTQLLSGGGQHIEAR